MRPPPYTIQELLPHGPPMLLLDAVDAVDDDCLVASVTIRPDSPFARSEGVPAHIGIELMAQACGALAGFLSLEAGEPVRVGFLMGARSASFRREWFAFGERLTVSVSLMYRDDVTAAMKAEIEIGGERVAEALLSVYQPPPGAIDGPERSQDGAT
jgi:predicted hotdog family 3-hydroxylacyl-ACP dehydratase